MKLSLQSYTLIEKMLIEELHKEDAPKLVESLRIALQELETVGIY